MSDYIPDHILSNVLLRLPFDSLIRFRCVSKSWRNLIDTSYFVGMHSKRSRLNQTNPHPDSKIIAFVGTKFYTFDSMVNDGKGACKAIAKELSCPAMEFEERGLTLAGSCNGILCLSSFRNDGIVLWNPFTRSNTELPSPPYEFTKKCRSATQTAFGLKLNSWRTIRDAITLELPEYYYYFPEDSAFVNGAVHWLVTDFLRRVDNFIVAFHLGTYKFRKVPCSAFPVKTGYIDPYMVKLGSLNGCLSLVRNTYSRTSHKRCGADIWVMEEYGVESSWTKLTWIDLNNDAGVWEIKPVAFSKKRGKLLLQASWEKLVIYDLKSKSFTDVAVEGEVSCYTSCVCVGSFVSTCSQSN